MLDALQSVVVVIGIGGLLIGAAVGFGLLRAVAVGVVVVGKAGNQRRALAVCVHAHAPGVAVFGHCAGAVGISDAGLQAGAVVDVIADARGGGDACQQLDDTQLLTPIRKVQRRRL